MNMLSLCSFRNTELQLGSSFLIRWYNVAAHFCWGLCVSIYFNLLLMWKMNAVIHGETPLSDSVSTLKQAALQSVILQLLLYFNCRFFDLPFVSQDLHRVSLCDMVRLWCRCSQLQIHSKVVAFKNCNSKPLSNWFCVFQFSAFDSVEQHMEPLFPCQWISYLSRLSNTAFILWSRKWNPFFL